MFLPFADLTNCIRSVSEVLCRAFHSHFVKQCTSCVLGNFVKESERDIGPRCKHFYFCHINRVVLLISSLYLH